MTALKQAGARVEYSISKYNHYDMRLERVRGTDEMEIEEPGTLGEWLEWLTPERLRKSLGVDFFRHVEYVDFHDVSELAPVVDHLRDLRGVRILMLGIGNAFDDDLPAVGQLRDLTHLQASYSTITDEGLVYLAPLRKLVHLDLSNNNIAGTGLVHLSGLARLEFLDLESNPIDDAGLEHLGPLLRLKTLDLSWTKVTGSGLRHLVALQDLQILALSYTKLKNEYLDQLASFRQLKHLSFHFTAIGDEGLQTLRDLSGLESLDLGATLVTDEGLGSLSPLASLALIDLQHTAITDRGLQTLGGLKSLKNVLLQDTAATPEGVAQLRKRLPKADINFRQSGTAAEDRARVKSRVLVDAGLWRQAIETQRKANDSYVRSADGLRDLGRCHAELGQWDDAERSYREALEATSQNLPEQWRSMDATWHELQAWPLLHERVALARPKDPWRWISSARTAVVDGLWSEAIEDYGRAVAPPHVWDSRIAMPNAVEGSVDFQYGLSRLFVKDIAGALRARDRLVARDPRIEEFELTLPYGYDFNLFAAAHLQLLAPQGTACPAAIADWLRNSGERDNTYGTLLPLIYLRSGRFAQVLSEERNSLDQENHGRVWFSQAMARHYLDRDSAARECFARGDQWLDRRIKRARLDRRYDDACGLLEAVVLRREAERLIGTGATAKASSTLRNQP